MSHIVVGHFFGAGSRWCWLTFWGDCFLTLLGLSVGLRHSSCICIVVQDIVVDRILLPHVVGDHRNLLNDLIHGRWRL